jgi:hypothetical protein
LRQRLGPGEGARFVAEVRAAGVATLTGIAKALTARGVATPSGRGAWNLAAVMRLNRRVQAT